MRRQIIWNYEFSNKPFKKILSVKSKIVKKDNNKNKTSARPRLVNFFSTAGVLVLHPSGHKINKTEEA